MILFYGAADESILNDSEKQSELADAVILCTLGWSDIQFFHNIQKEFTQLDKKGRIDNKKNMKKRLSKQDDKKFKKHKNNRQTRKKQQDEKNQRLADFKIDVDNPKYSGFNKQMMIQWNKYLYTDGHLHAMWRYEDLVKICGEHITVGHRYISIRELVLCGRVCGVSLEKIVNDAFSLQQIYNKKAKITLSHPLTDDEVWKALTLSDSDAAHQINWNIVYKTLNILEYKPSADAEKEHANARKKELRIQQQNDAQKEEREAAEAANTDAIDSGVRNSLLHAQMILDFIDKEENKQLRTNIIRHEHVMDTIKILAKHFDRTIRTMHRWMNELASEVLFKGLIALLAIHGSQSCIFKNFSDLMNEKKNQHNALLLVNASKDSLKSSTNTANRRGLRLKRQYKKDIRVSHRKSDNFAQKCLKTYSCWNIELDTGLIVNEIPVCEHEIETPNISDYLNRNRFYQADDAANG